MAPPDVGRSGILDDGEGGRIAIARGLLGRPSVRPYDSGGEDPRLETERRRAVVFWRNRPTLVPHGLSPTLSGSVQLDEPVLVEPVDRDADRHDRPVAEGGHSLEGAVAARGFALVTTVQLVPSQCSTNVDTPVDVLSLPTA